MKLYAGIDGGQSSTTAVVGDERGTILGTGHAGPADEVGENAQSVRLQTAFRSALRNALRAASLPADAELQAVVAGLSGFNGTTVGADPRERIKSATFVILHDTRIAHAGAFAGRPGVLVIAGTGSVAFGTNEAGQECRIGGRGYLFGDEGSAFWIGRRLVERVMLDEDAALPSPLSKPVLEYFGVRTIGEVSDGFYRGKIDRANIAGLARVASVLAHQGLDDAYFFVDQAADAIAALAALCARRLHGNKRTVGHDVQVAVCGGLAEDQLFAGRVAQKLAARLPEARIVPFATSPAAGALLLAYRTDRIEQPPGAPI